MEQDVDAMALIVASEGRWEDAPRGAVLQEARARLAKVSNG